MAIKPHVPNTDIGKVIDKPLQRTCEHCGGAWDIPMPVPRHDGKLIPDVTGRGLCWNCYGRYKLI